MANGNASLEKMDIDLDKLEEELSKQLEENFSDLEILKKDREKIGNPEALGDVLKKEVLNQFANQVGLDITSEMLIETYDKNHPNESYEIEKDKVMQDKAYRDANKEMKDKHRAGTLRDEYTGKMLDKEDTPNLDHVVARKRVYEKRFRKTAGKTTAELANKKENLVPTNESANKSKGAKSAAEYTDPKKRQQRENDLKKLAEKKNQKIKDDPKLSKREKEEKIAKNNKRLNDKLAVDSEKMKQKEKEANTAIDRDILEGATKNISKRATFNAMKQMAIKALMNLLQEVTNGFVKFIKEKNNSLKNFIQHMKEALSNFFKRFKEVVKSGSSNFMGTVISEIIDPFIKTIKKFSSMIKQGVASLKQAIDYLRDSKNKDKPLSIKIAEIGKIVTAGLVSGGALLLGEVFEKGLLNIPGMQVSIPMFGSLANIIGMFLASLIAGIFGAWILNKIDQVIAKKLKAETDKKIINKNNEILATQTVQIDISEKKVTRTKKEVSDKIRKNHAYASEEMNRLLLDIFKAQSYDDEVTDFISENEATLDALDKELDNLV